MIWSSPCSLTLALDLDLALDQGLGLGLCLELGLCDLVQSMFSLDPLPLALGPCCPRFGRTILESLLIVW